MNRVLPSPGFWNGKKVLVTGHTGFKGGWLCLWLKMLGAELSGLALAPDTEPNLFDLTGLARSLDHRVIDIRDAAKLDQALAAIQPEIVIHMAAQAIVGFSYDDPVGTFASNVMGTVNVLDAIRRTPAVKAAVIITSDKCYHNPESDIPRREGDQLGGNDPYSSSKACAELVTTAYRRSFMSGQGQAAVASARAGNVLGGGDWSPLRVVPDAVRAFSQNQPVVLRHPNAVRPWQHVLDPLAGYLVLAEKLYREGQAYAEAWNFGPQSDTTCTVAELVDRLAALWGGGAEWRKAPDSPFHESGLLFLDVDKARDRLGFVNQLDLDQTLRLTVDWHRAHLSGRDLLEVSQAQISRYTDGC